MTRPVATAAVFALILAIVACSTGAGPTPTPAAPRPTSITPPATRSAVSPSQPRATAAPAPTPSGTTRPPPAPAVTGPTLAQLVGQKLIITMAGRKPDAALLDLVRNGQIGGVVLLSSNIRSKTQLLALTRKLQHTASDAGQPRLVISVDQEGGSVKRVPWAPPTITVPEMGSMGSSDVAESQGRKTGKALKAVGINVDLAPVADVPRGTASFMYQQGRTFSFNAGRTARLADAFQRGLVSVGVMATMKHFPGIGLAIKNTDLYVDTIQASKETLQTDLRPYRRAIGDGLPLVMLSNVRYTAWDRAHAAGWSAAIALGLLRDTLGFDGVSITDSLSGTAHARGVTARSLALKAAAAGTDLILVTGSEKTSASIYRALLAAAQDNSIATSTLRASYDRILALKARLSLPPQ